MKNKLKLLSIAFLIGICLISCKKENTIFDVKPKHFLEDNKYESLTVEIVSVEGQEPNQKALTNLKVFIAQRLNKPEGITFVQSTVSSPNNNIFSASDLRDLEVNVRSRYTERKKLAAFIFYADQGYIEDTEDSKVLGVAYGPTSMCIFKKTISENTGGLTQASEEDLETAVLMHEFGHILGLVNNGTPMTQGHEDVNRPHHCDNENCLMYFESKTSDITGLLGGGGLPTLDSQCLNDLKANGGK